MWSGLWLYAILKTLGDETADTNPQKPSDGNGAAIAYGMLAGMMAGIIFGVIMNDIAMWLAIGTGLGIALGASFSETKPSN